MGGLASFSKGKSAQRRWPHFTPFPVPRFLRCASAVFQLSAKMPVWIFPWALNSRAWALNSAVECHPHTVEVVGSNPTAPTIFASGPGFYGNPYFGCGASRKLESRERLSGAKSHVFPTACGSAADLHRDRVGEFYERYARNGVTFPERKGRSSRNALFFCPAAKRL